MGATLDSILKQTYLKWECIVIDDGSGDYTKELMELYCRRDSRIKYHLRPRKRRKGANACRNYGFELSKGKYIQWFDSDDLMLPEFLSIKVKAIECSDVDFVISKALNFRDPYPDDIISMNTDYYRFDKFSITNYNYIVQNINWLTYDFLGRREVIGKVQFNEKLQSSQERNFFSKLTVFTVKAKVLDAYLTKRRIHDFSTQNSLREDNHLRKVQDRAFYKETWKEISFLDQGSDAEKFLLLRLLELNSREFPNSQMMVHVILNLIKRKRYKTAYAIFFYKYVHCITGRGNVFRRIFMNSL